MGDADPQAEILRAVWGYLAQRDFPRTCEALREEAGLAEPPAEEAGRLEARWGELQRLQARVEELEALLAARSEPEPRQRGLPAVSAAPGGLRDPRLRLEAECAGHKEAVTAVALHAAEPVVASGSADCFVRLFDYELQSRLALLRGHTQAVHCVAWAGNALVSGSADLSLRVWQSPHQDDALAFGDFVCARTLIGHEHAVSGLVNLPNSDLTFSCSRDSTLRLWDRSTGACRRTVRAHRDWARCLDANERHLVSAGNEKRLFVFDLSRLLQGDDGDAPPLHSFEVHDNYVEAVQLQRAGGEAHVAFTAARDKAVRMWDYLRAQLLRSFAGHDSWVLALAVLEEDAFLLSAGEDRALRVWDARRGAAAHAEEKAHASFVLALGYRARDRLLATGGADRCVRLWRVVSGPAAGDAEP